MRRRHFIRIRSWLVLAAAWTMVLWSNGAHASLFDDQPALQRAVQDIRVRATAPLKVLAIIIEPDALTLRVQDPYDRRHVVEWRWTTPPRGRARRDPVSGPTPIDPNLIN